MIGLCRNYKFFVSPPSNSKNTVRVWRLDNSTRPSHKSLLNCRYKSVTDVRLYYRLMNLVRLRIDRTVVNTLNLTSQLPSEMVLVMVLSKNFTCTKKCASRRLLLMSLYDGNMGRVSSILRFNSSLMQKRLIIMSTNNFCLWRFLCMNSKLLTSRNYRGHGLISKKMWKIIDKVDDRCNSRTTIHNYNY